MASEWDAVVVGARCAGATLALALADAGARVLMVDQATFPSETISTHFLYPNTLARLESLGVMDRLRAEHAIPLLLNRLSINGNEMIGGYTPVDGYDRGASITRPVLDNAIIECAVAAGAKPRLGVKVVELLGSGTVEDPVTGVVLETGEAVRAPWTFGADGRTSFVARSLGLEKRNEMAGDLSGFFAYWSGLPASEYGDFVLEGRHSIGWFPSEDGTHMVALNGEKDMTRGDAETRERIYAEGIRSLKTVIDPDALDRAERISDLRVVPETMVRGSYKRASGPGWALVGDSGHFKHPSTAQGISDAIEQAVHVVGAVNGADPRLESYERWRDARAAEHYELSFTFATWPDANGNKLFAGVASDDEAAQQLRDVLARTVKPSQVFTGERLARWFA